jgi:hypothetical protein
VTTEPARGPDAGGVVALQVAQAHLNAYLASINAVESKTMFLIGLHAALVSAFVGLVAALGQPAEAVIGPIVIALAAVVLGWVGLWPRNVPHFPSPEETLRYRGAQWRAGADAADDALAWVFVESISGATVVAAEIMVLKSRIALLLFTVSILQVATIVGIAILLAG